MQELINGVHMHWREEGSGDAVLFLHAFPFHSAMWDAQLAELPQGWRGIAPDLRGFGRTAAAGDGPYTMDLFAEDMAALLRHLNVRNAVVCGLSMGGYIALALYRLHPDIVRALVLCDTRAGADTAEGKQARLQLAERARMEGARPVADAMLPRVVSEYARRNRPDAALLAEQMLQSNHPQSMARALEGMAARPSSEDWLRNLQIPVMIIHGEDDAIVPGGEAQMMTRAIRGARLHVIPDTGHLSNLEQPDVFNKFLGEFLLQLPPSFGSLKLA